MGPAGSGKVINFFFVLITGALAVYLCRLEQLILCLVQAAFLIQYSV